MSELISHTDWMKFTDGGRTSRRSSELRKVDQALLNYHANPSPTNRSHVASALSGWCRFKGAGWRSSIRNKNNTVENLQRQLEGGRTRGGAEEMIALSAVRDEARAIATDLFQGQQLVFRDGLIPKLAGDGTLGKIGARLTVANTAKHGAKLAKAAKGALSDERESSNIAATLLNELIPLDLKPLVMAHLNEIIPGFIKEYSAACLPFVGVGVSGLTVIVGAGKTLNAQWKLSQASMHAERSLSTENPELAFQALIRMLRRCLLYTSPSPRDS